MHRTQQWLAAIGAAGSPRDIAKYAGVSHATLYRQISQGQLTFDVVLNLARHYEVSPIAALVANGFLTEEEASVAPTTSALQNASDDELIEEVARRLRAGSGEVYDIRPSEVGRDRFTVIASAASRNIDLDEEPIHYDRAQEGVLSAEKLAAHKGRRRADQPHAE